MIAFINQARRTKRLLKKLSKNIKKAIFCTSNPKAISTQIHTQLSSVDQWIQVYEPFDESKYSAICHGGKRIDFFELTPSQVPAVGIAQLKNARLHGIHGWVFNRDGILFPDQSWFGSDVDGMARHMEIPRKVPQGEIIKGTTLTIASDFATYVYGHYVIDSLARLALFYKAGFSLDDLDYVFLPAPLKGHGEVLFNLLGIPREKCIWANDGRTLRCENLISPSFPGLRRNYTPWVVDFFRQNFNIDYSKPATRRLYITRKGFVRNPVNESLVEQLLHRYGFETYNPAHHSHAHQDFAEAEIVVGVSGSALTGLAFCRPKTKVLELLSTEHLYPYYFTLANAGDMEYHYIAGEPETLQNSSFGPSQNDIIIDLDILEAALRQLIESDTNQITEKR